jgi:hypothetical protein
MNDAHHSPWQGAEATIWTPRMIALWDKLTDAQRLLFRGPAWKAPAEPMAPVRELVAFMRQCRRHYGITVNDLLSVYFADGFGGGEHGEHHHAWASGQWTYLDEQERKAPPKRILSGTDFIARHVPPVWLIDGIVQRSRLYACTSLTGHGKTAIWLFNACMIQAGRMIGQLDVFQGNVLFLAGENPADLEARMIGMARAYKLALNRLPYVLPGGFPLTEEEAVALKRRLSPATTISCSPLPVRSAVVTPFTNEDVPRV